MIKKLVLVLAILALLIAPVEAGSSVRRVIPATDLTKGNSETAITLATRGMEKLTVFFEYSQNGTVPLDITFDVSYDGSNWLDAKFYDYTGGATLQTSEQLTSDTWYYAYWINELKAPYIRIHTIGNTWTTNSTATITVYVIEDR